MKAEYILIAAVVAAASHAEAGDRPFAEVANSLFEIASPSNRISPVDSGLVNGHISFNGWLNDVGEVRGLFAPPYYSTDFTLIMRVNGENVRSTSHVWRPEVLRRIGTNGAWRITSSLYPVAGERAGIMEVVAENVSALPQRLYVNCLVGGGVGRQDSWQFGKPLLPPVATLRYDDWIAVLDGAANDVQVAVSLPGGVRALDFREVPPGDCAGGRARAGDDVGADARREGKERGAG